MDGANIICQVTGPRENRRSRELSQCTYSKRIILKWDVMVANLTKPNMSPVNPNLITIRKLYDATNPAWCKRER